MGHQKSNQEFWIDESGNKVPYSRTTKTERLMERTAAKLLKDAKQLNEKLKQYKEAFAEACNAVYQSFLQEKEISTDRKGNFTWYNFDRSIKIELSINERVTFDDLLITSAREKLNMFLTDNVSGKTEFIKEMVIDAFKTSKGQLDSKKIMNLLKYKGKIKDKLFQSAMEDIESSIRRPSSRKYFRISERQPDGEYKAIDLNFSSI
jgi:hypothetical protein